MILRRRGLGTSVSFLVLREGGEGTVGVWECWG